MNEVLNLMELTTSQLEAALELGEGLSDVNILEIENVSIITAIWVATTDGKATRLTTQARYQILLEDEMEENGEIMCAIFVQVSNLGIVAKF